MGFGVFLMAVGLVTAYAQARGWERNPRISAYGVFVGGFLFAAGLFHVIDKVV